jgi:hypothetical protein
MKSINYSTVVTLWLYWEVLVEPVLVRVSWRWGMICQSHVPASSNTMSSIQPALRDRMEIIKMMSEHTIEEKWNCSSAFVAETIKRHGLTAKDLTIGRNN